MDLLSPQEVRQLPMNTKEKEHRSRKRRAFNVFLSRGVENLLSLSNDRQRELYHAEFGNHAGASDCDSIDSTDTLYMESLNAPLKYRFLMKIVCKQWERIGGEKKKAWEDRATFLNSRNLPGAIYSIPSKFFLQFLHSLWLH